MTFIVQFKRFRRGVPEVIRELHLHAVDGAAALASAQGLVGTRHWPVRTGALRIMDDNGRTLIDWTVPATRAQPVIQTPIRMGPDADEPVPPIAAAPPAEPQSAPETRRHLFAVGQPVWYSEDGRPEIWQGGYEIIRLDDPVNEPQYAIRNADGLHDRIVHEHELRADLGSRARVI